MADDHRSRSGDYRAARIGAAATLTIVLCMLVLWDAISPAYAVDLPVLFGFLAAIVTLLGLDAKNLRGG